jgi:thymidylate kinase
MLITFSGIVGSGKSTYAMQAQRFLTEADQQPVYLRFRFLSWKKMLTPVSKTKKAKKSRQVDPGQQETILRTNQVTALSFIRFAGYFGRMLNFRLFRLVMLRNRIAICDRYFYDNLVHYRLSSRRERLYLHVLKIALPQPDLGFMLIAEPQTILQRRANYASNYIYRLSENYQKVAGRFGNLTLLKTDEAGVSTQVVAQRVHEKIKAKLSG